MTLTDGHLYLRVMPMAMRERRDRRRDSRSSTHVSKHTYPAASRILFPTRGAWPAGGR
jgi:hypothetical protein